MSTHPMRPAWLMAFALVAWGAATASAQGVDQLLGRVVSDVRVLSKGQAVRDAQLERLIEIRAGDVLRMDAGVTWTSGSRPRRRATPCGLTSSLCRSAACGKWSSRASSG